MKETTRYHIKYPEGTDLVRNASAQFEAMAQSIDDNIDDLPDTITQKVTDAQTLAEQAAHDARTYSASTQKLQDDAVAALLRDTTSNTNPAAFADWYSVVSRLGADRHGDKDVSSIINDVDFSDWPALYFPAGRYRIDKPLKIPGNISVYLDPNAVIAPSSTMACLIKITAVDNGSYASQGRIIQGGRLDCANLAPIGLQVMQPQYRISNMTVINASEAAYDLPTWQVRVVNCLALHTSACDGIVTGFRSNEDGSFLGCIASGYTQGFEALGGLNRYIGCYAWKGGQNAGVRNSIGINLHDSMGLVDSCYMDRYAIGVNRDDLTVIDKPVSIVNYCTYLSEYATESGDDLTLFHVNPNFASVHGVVSAGPSKTRVFPSFVELGSVGWYPGFNLMQGNLQSLKAQSVVNVDSTFTPANVIGITPNVVRINIPASGGWVQILEGVPFSESCIVVANIADMANHIDFDLTVTIVDGKIQSIIPSVHTLIAPYKGKTYVGWDRVETQKNPVYRVYLKFDADKGHYNNFLTIRTKTAANSGFASPPNLVTVATDNEPATGWQSLA